MEFGAIAAWLGVRWQMEQPVRRAARPRRRGYWIFVAAYFACASLAYAWLGTPDSDQHRRLAAIHDARAGECRRSEQSARAAGRVQEAQALAQSAASHAWFARAHAERAEWILGQRWNFRFWRFW